MLPIALKLTAPVFVLVGCLHLVFGLGADVMLGANVDSITLSDPVLDSQNRFYGVAFTVYGFLLYLCASDLIKYQTVLRTLIWVFFAAGCARLVSMVTPGTPSFAMMGLLALEVLLPPIVHVWLNRTLQSGFAKHS